MSSVAHMLDAQFRGSESFSFLARRNCSIAPLRLCALFLALAGVSLGIAVAWAFIAGAWLVLPFAGIEILALGLALLCYGRRSGDYERISLNGGILVVEVCELGQVRRYEFNPLWVRVVTGGPDVRLALRSHGHELEIGRHLDAAARRRLGAELRRLMRPRQYQFDSHSEA